MRKLNIKYKISVFTKNKFWQNLLGNIFVPSLQYFICDLLYFCSNFTYFIATWSSEILLRPLMFAATYTKVESGKTEKYFRYKSA